MVSGRMDRWRSRENDRGKASRGGKLAVNQVRRVAGGEGGVSKGGA